MNTLLLSIGLVVSTVFLMEFAAWGVHKYIMHGWGWGWHRSHHEPHDDSLEKNDLYAAFFAAFAILLFWLGTAYWSPLWWIAVGVTVYGVLYFIAHDGLVHKRWPFRYVPKSGYLKRLYQAHRLHHAVIGRNGCVSFGFLWAPSVDSLKRQLRHNRKTQNLALYDSEKDALTD